MSDYWIFSGGFDLYAGLKEAAAGIGLCLFVVGMASVFWNKVVGQGEQAGKGK